MAKHKIARQAAEPCEPGGEKEVLLSILRAFDAPAPLWLPKHEREMDAFRRTAFARADFMESVSFDRLEMEFIDDDAPRRSRDPRNEF